MKTTFKNVGQGDTIIIEWESKGKKKIGIVDCKLNDEGENVVIKFFKENGYQYISFIILTHPHLDHFSGLLQLLEFCADNKIPINFFYHNCHLDPAYIKFVFIDEEEKNLFKRIIRKAIQLHKIGLIKQKSPIHSDTVLRLNADSQIRSMSPTDTELDKYTEIVHTNKFINRHLASSAANYLSTILILEKGKKYGILTSDSEYITFDRLLNNKKDLFAPKQLSFGQLSHHGSKKNYHHEFWKYIENVEDRPIIISAGRSKNNHPDYSVIKAILSLNYSLEITNLVNGAAEYFNEFLMNDLLMSNALDDDSELIKLDEGRDIELQL